jgi:hypothetical protein
MMQGARLPDGEFFDRQSAGTLRPGDYGREFITKARDGAEVKEWDWFAVCPNGARTVLWVNEDDSNGNGHIVTEHDDGTITVGGVDPRGAMCLGGANHCRGLARLA